jgi:hypothetical protein
MGLYYITYNISPPSDTGGLKTGTNTSSERRFVMKRLSVFVVSALVTFSAVSSSYAIGGLGFHWGFDYSLSMDDVKNERVSILPDISGLPDELQGVVDGVDFFRISRTEWRRSAINFGGKAYIDMIPFIEAVEVSCNFGLWQYDGLLEYIDIIGTGASGKPNYKPLDLTLGKLGMPEYIGLDGTPYAKLQLDATVRKTLLNLWIIKLSGGAGFSSHFATPLLTSTLVEGVLGKSLNDPATLNALLSGNLGTKVGKDIVQKILDEAMGKPVYGMHILLGLKAKLPVMPVGLYIDGKYMIPFTDYDKDAGGKSINGYGLLLNAGLSLSI